MKAADLMIGDWVMVKERKNDDVKDYPIMVYSGNIGDIVAENLIVESIPLTEEILKKNGFKNDVIAQKSIIAEGASNFSIILISEDNRITINNIDEYLNSFNKWYIHIDTEDMRTLCTAEITYVHELQHLLKLCKIEKEIILL